MTEITIMSPYNRDTFILEIFYISTMYERKMQIFYIFNLFIEIVTK